MATLIRYRKGYAITKGPFVADIQIFLNNESRFSFSAYPRLNEDGAFGPKTKARVEEWQMFNGLKVDGIVGPNTWFKMFHDTMPLAVAQAMDAVTGALGAATESTQLEPGFLYMLDSSCVDEAKLGSGVYRRAPHHPFDQCSYFICKPGQFGTIADDLGDFVEEERLKIKEMIMLGHSAGAGHLSFSGNSPHLGANSVTLFRRIKSRFMPGAIITIYGCSFAAARRWDVTYDSPRFEALMHWILNDAVIPGDLRHGPGISAMQDIAKYTGCEVRAGFTSQVGDFRGNQGPWAQVMPNGSYKFHVFGNNLELQDWAKLAADGSFWASISPLASFLWGERKLKLWLEASAHSKEA